MKKIKTVQGIISDGSRIILADITCRVTVDHLGATLSLSDDTKVMLSVPLEPLADMIRPVKEDT